MYNLYIYIHFLNTVITVLKFMFYEISYPFFRKYDNDDKIICHSVNNINRIEGLNMKFHYLNNSESTIQNSTNEIDLLTNDLKLSLSSIVINHNYTDFEKQLNSYSNEDILIINKIDSLGTDLDTVIKNIELALERGMYIFIYNLYENDLLINLNVNETYLHEIKSLNLQLLSIIKWCAEKSDDSSFLKTYANNIQLAVNHLKTRGRPRIYSSNSTDPEGKKTYYQIIEMYKEGKSISKISSATNISRTTIYKILEESELKNQRP